MKEEPPLSAKCKDKFLVQSTLITPAKELLTAADIWNPTDDKEENKIHQQKIKVVYLPPEGQVVEEEQEVTQTSTLTLDDSRYDTVRGTAPNGYQTYMDSIEPAVIVHTSTTPPPLPRTPPREQVINTAGPSDFIVESTRQADYEPTVNGSPDPSPRRNREREREREPPTVNINVHTPPAPTSNNTNNRRYSNPAPLDAAALEQHTRVAELADEVSKLRAQVATLQAENAALALRRRGPATTNVAQSEDGSIVPGDMVSEADTYQTYGTYTEGSVVHTDGVPPQVVALIAFSVFFATYLFF
jgi:hypothetical protein